MKKKVFSVVLLLVIIFPIICLADVWYCPECGRQNDGNYCPKDGTARPSMTDYQSSSQTIQTYYFSNHALNFPHTYDFDVYTGPGVRYVRASNGRALFESKSFKYGGLDGDWMFVRCQVKGGMRYGYIYVGDFRQTVQNVPSLIFSNQQATTTKRTGIWDSLMDRDLQPVCYLDKGTTVTYLCDFYIDGMTVAYVETYYNNQPVRGFVYTDSIR